MGRMGWQGSIHQTDAAMVGIRPSQVSEFSEPEPDVLLLKGERIARIQGAV